MSESQKTNQSNIPKTQSKKSKISSKIAIALVSIVVITIAGTLGREVASNLFKSSKVKSESSIDTQLMNIASEMNKGTPFMVDSETRLDNTVAGPNRSIYYNYTMINYGIDEIDLNFFESQLRPTILNGIKTSPDMKILREKKVTFIYSYKDKTGKHLISFKFTPKEYQ